MRAFVTALAILAAPLLAAAQTSQGMPAMRNGPTPGPTADPTTTHPSSPGTAQTTAHPSQSPQTSASPVPASPPTGAVPEVAK